MHSRKDEKGLDRQSWVSSVQSPLRLRGSKRYGSPLRASGRVIGIGLPTALFRRSVWPNPRSGDIAAREWGQGLNPQSSEGQPKEQKVGREVSSCMATGLGLGTIYQMEETVLYSTVCWLLGPTMGTSVKLRYIRYIPLLATICDAIYYIAETA